MSAGLPGRVRAARPLVHAITNYVTMEWVARGLLAAGARPVMARDEEEAKAAARQADALLLNLGTWSPGVHAAMLAAGSAAAAKGIPVVLDPVGAGAMTSRTGAARLLLEQAGVTAVRGNAGEILALAGEAGLVRGVDAVGAVRGARLERAAREVARRYGCIVAVTGRTDLVTDGYRMLSVCAGHPLMEQIPGAGCLVSGLIAAAQAAELPGDPLETVAQALLWAGWAGEQAAARASGPGSFAAAYLDALAAAAELPEGRVVPPLSRRLALLVIVDGSTPLAALEAVLEAGCRAIQFREKRMPLPAQVEVAARMRELCRRYGALFVVNDRVDLALAVGADGVHLGQEDLPVAAARQILGPAAIIGGTCETEEEARRAEEQGADYIGVGPVYATPSKADAGDPYGPAVVARVSAATRLPVVGVGGIGIGGAAPVIRAGACGVAVITAVWRSPNPGEAARALLEEVLEAAKGVQRR